VYLLDYLIIVGTNNCAIIAIEGNKNVCNTYRWYDDQWERQKNRNSDSLGKESRSDGCILTALGKTLWETTGKTIKKDLDVNVLSSNMIHRRILWYWFLHLTDPTFVFWNLVYLFSVHFKWMFVIAYWCHTSLLVFLSSIWLSSNIGEWIATF